MNLRYTDGCTCTSYDVDGTEFIDLSIEKQRELAIKLINYTNNDYVFSDIYKILLENSVDLYDMSKEQVTIFYEAIDEKVEQFKKLSKTAQKKINVDYITNYNISDSNADWLYQHVFEQVLEADGQYKFLGHCDCCGDSIREYKLKI